MQNTHTRPYKQFLERLSAARKERGLTQADVAQALKWPQSRVSRMESGERRIDVIEAKALATLYKRSLLDLVP